MSYRFHIKRLLRKAGYDLVRFDVSHSATARRMRLLRHYGIDLVLDVGANAGRYARDLRRTGYRGRIVSFEPLSSAYAGLARAAAQDPLWETVNVALGREHTTAQLHVARNSESSSLLEMLPRHVEAAPEAAYTDAETVAVRRLDDLFAAYDRASARVLLKIDAQGYERHILDGARQTLGRITGLQLEMSLVPLYEGETLFRPMIDLLAAQGFALMSIEPGFSDPVSGRLLQMDGLFFRE